MCMLTFFPEGALPNEEALANGAVVNEDGHGFAIVTGRTLLVERGMDAAQLIAEFVRARAQFPDGPALFHSRLATAGDIDEANCHPFRVGKSPLTVLAHNGIFPLSMQPSRRDKRSDTRIAAEDFLPGDPFGSLGARRNRRRMERWMTDRNKVVILTVDPRYRKRAYLLNEDAGVWDDGVWYSNTDYLGGHWVTYDDDWDEQAYAGAQECPACETVTYSVSTLDRQCQACGLCFECEMWQDACECQPGTAGTTQGLRVNAAGDVEWWGEIRAELDHAMAGAGQKL